MGNYVVIKDKKIIRREQFVNKSFFDFAKDNAAEWYNLTHPTTPQWVKDLAK